MPRSIPESDWKLFREIHSFARDRYCQKILKEIEHVLATTSKSTHQRYLEIYKLISKRDRDLARAFDDFRRSTAATHLGLIYSYGVITEAEISRFTPATRASVSAIATLGV